ncbi:MAG: nucleoside phosphorylase [Holosporales bacterium]
MSLPYLKHKVDYESLTTPQRYLEYRRSLGQVPVDPPPRAVILCYQKKLMSHLLAHHVGKSGYGFLNELHFLKPPFEHIAVHPVRFTPDAAARTEVLIALGVKHFITIGTAGALHPDLSLGDIVVCTKALRDEGISHHYLPPEDFAYPCPQMTDKLEQALQLHGVPHVKGPTWTLEAIFRETAEEVKTYRDLGILTVEMEAAALFAVARYRQVSMGGMFTISDSLADFNWRPQFDHVEVRSGLETLYLGAVTALRDI